MNDELTLLIATGALDEAVVLLSGRHAPAGQQHADCLRLVDALMAQGRDADADGMLDRAETALSKQAAVPMRRAQLAARRGDARARLEQLAMAFNLAPHDALIAADYVSALIYEGRQDQALRALREHSDHSRFAHEALPRWREPERPAWEADAAARNAGLYLDLLERAVSNWIYCDARDLYGDLVPFQEEVRREGRDIPSQAHTMIGLKRLRHLRTVAEQALAQGVAGDFVEAGAWRGGACILLAGVLRAHAVQDRRVVVADSFAGLPPPDERYAEDALSTFDFHLRPELSVSLEQVRRNFDRYGLLDDERVAFLPGLFRDTLPVYPHGAIAVLRMDGDLYSSTMDTLNCLYPLVTRGGWVISDDYGVVIDARRAVLDFRAQHGISTPMFSVDGDAVFWRKD